jgi:tape measure domain-containing protein
MAQNIIFKISADTSNFDEGLKKTGKAVDDVGKKTKKATQEAGVFQQALGKIGSAVAGAFAVSEIIRFGKEMTKVSAEMESLRIRLEGIYGSQEKAGSVFAELGFMASKFGIELKTLTENYASFVAGAKASGMEVGKAEKIFKSMTIAIKGSGANAETAKRAFVALTQMIGKGKIQAEELRGQLGEAMPAAFGIMAKSLGVTTQELDKMMASGNLIASEVLPKFAEEMENAFGENASKLASGLQADLARLENAWTSLYLTASNSGASELGVKLLTGAVKGFDNALTGATATLLTLFAVFDGGEAMSNFLNEVEKKNILEFEAEYRAFQQRQIDSFIRTSTEQKKTSKETADALIKDAERADKQRIELLTKVGKLTKDELATIEKRRHLDPAWYEREINKLLTQRSQLTEDEKKQLIELKVKADLYRESAQSLIPPKQKTKELTKEELRELERLNELELDRLLQATQLSATDPFDYQIAEATFDADIEDKRVKAENKMLDEIFKANEQSLAERHEYGEISEEDYLQKRLELYEQFGKDVRKVEAEINKTTEKGGEVRTKQTWTEAQTREYALSQTLNTMDALNNAYTISQTNQLQKQLEQGVISQEQYEQSLRKIKRRQAVIDKAGALFNIALNTAQGVSSAAGSVLGLPLAPVIGALGAIQAGIVLATPIPYNKGTKKVPMVRGAVRGKDSVHAILTPNERVVPEDINTQPGYSALMDLAHDRKISDKEAGFIAKLATGGVYAGQSNSDIDYNQLGKSIAKYIPHTDVRIDHNGIAVITDRSHANMNRLKTRL